MKLTKGALTMLLAQYRAIYKNAFIKGLASAALATAVLASGSAGAAEITDITFTDQTGTGLPYLNAGKTELKLVAGTNKDTFKFTQNLQSPPATLESFVIEDTSATFTGATLAVDKNFSLKSAGTLIVGDGKTENKLSLGKADTSKNISLNGTLEVKTKGTLEFLGSADNVAKLNLTGAKITNGGKINFGEALADLSVVENLAVGTADSGKTAVITGTNLAIGTAQLDSYLVKGDAASDGEIAIANGGTLEVKGTTKEAAFNVGKYFGGDTEDDASHKGKITLSKNAAHTGTLKADYAVVDGALATATGKLTVDAKNLTVGKEGTALDSALGFEKGIVSNELIIEGQAGTENLIKDSYEFLAKDDANHKVISSNKIALNEASKGFTFLKGNWTIDADVSVGNGVLSVDASTAKTKDNESVNVGFASGKTLSIADGKGVSVKGGTNKLATLDLSNVTLDYKGANASLKADVYGTLKLGNLSEELFKKSKFDVVANGTLEITSDLTLKGSDFIKDGDATAGKIKLLGTLKADSLTVEAEDNGEFNFSTLGNANFNLGKLNLEAAENAEMSIAELKVKDSVVAGNLTLKTGNLVLGDSEKPTTNGEFTADSLTVTAGNVTVNGAWNLNGSDVTLAKSDGKLEVVGDKSSLMFGGKLKLESSATGASLIGKADFESLELATGSKLTVGDTNATTSHLIINGTKNNDVATAPDLKLDGGVTLSNNSTFEIGRDALDEIFASTSGGALDTTGKLKDKQAITSKITLADTSVIKFDFTKDDKISFTADKDGSGGTLKALKDSFAGNAGGFKGFINLGDASIDGLIPEEHKVTAPELQNNENAYKWDSVKDLADVQVTTNKLENAVIETTKDEATKGVSGNFGAFFVDDKANLKVAKNTIIQNAASNTHNGVSYFVSKRDSKGNIVASDVTVTDNSTLALKNSGVIGKVTGKKSAFDLSGEGLIKTEAVDVNKFTSTGVNAEIAGKLTTNTVSTHGSNVVVSDVVTVDNNKSEIAGGSFVAKKGFEFKGTDNNTFDVVDGAKFSVEGKLTAAGAINVGRALDEKNPDVKASSATMFVEDSTAFTGKLNLESDGKKATLAVFNTESPKAGLIDSNVVIKPAPAPKMLARDGGDAVTTPVVGAQFGKRYAFNHDANLDEGTVAAYGFKSEQDAISALEQAKLLKSDLSLESGVSAVAMFNVATELADNKNVNLNSEDKANAGAIKLGKNSVIAITDRAFLDDKGGKTAAAITSKKVDSTVAIDKDAQGNQVNTKVVLAGNFSAQDANLHIFGENLKLADGQTLFAESANGLLKGEIGADGTVNKLEVQTDKVNNLNASYPVKQYILKFAENKAEFTKANADAKLNKLAQDMAMGDTGIAIEQSARFAVYGGSVKAAELASKAGTDAIKSYTKGTANVATAQTATGSIFVVPTYKSSDSDSFNAEGVDFGSDIKLSGVALGADYMVAPNVKVGAMFNVGTGDADGKGIASGFETDLDYVGGGLFLNYNQDALNITADLTYTQSSADMKANVVGVVDANKMTTDVDTKAISLGVQGAYKFDLDGSYATPYAGMRLTKYDIDSYTVQVDGKSFMNNDADTMTVFSIPVGVELGTQMTAGDWTVEPSLDLGVTFNLDDTDLTHSATAVTKTSGVNLTSEVLDDVVFGIKGALKANYNGLSLGLGLGYEVGSNADDLSVQATGVYTF